MTFLPTHLFTIELMAYPSLDLFTVPANSAATYLALLGKSSLAHP